MRTLALIALLPLTALADTANTTARTLNTLGDGIWEIRHPDAPDGFPQGNTTVIAGDKAVLVVDSCLCHPRRSRTSSRSASGPRSR